MENVKACDTYRFIKSDANFSAIFFITDDLGTEKPGRRVRNSFLGNSAPPVNLPKNDTGLVSFCVLHWVWKNNLGNTWPLHVF